MGAPQGRGIGPISLKLTKITALMTEVAKGQANSPQLETQWDYRGVAAHGMANVYSRNIAHRKLPLADFSQSSFKQNTSLESAERARRSFRGTQQKRNGVLLYRVPGYYTASMGVKNSSERGKGRSLENGVNVSRLSSEEGIVVEEKQNGPPWKMRPSPQKGIA